MTLDTQLFTMIAMVSGGVYLGFATETFRRISVLWENKQLFTYCLEIMYWIGQTCILFFILYMANEGELRVYAFLACFLGFSMYVVLFKTIYQHVLEWIIKIIISIMKTVTVLVNSLILKPIKWIFQMLLQLVVYIGKVSCKLSLFIIKLMFYPFKLLLSLVKPLIPEKILKKVYQIVTFYSTILYKSKKWLKSFSERRR